MDRDDLVQDITQTKQLNTLKKIAKTNDQFKSLRGIKYTFDALKKAMLEALLPTEIASEHLKEEDALKEEGEVQEVEKKPEMKVSKPIKKEVTKTVITRQSAVLSIIGSKCKKPLSINQIGEFSNDLYNKTNEGAKKISKVDNMVYVANYTVLPLVEFGVLKIENSKYVLS